MKKITVLSVLLIFLSSFAFAGAVNLPRTGQTKCWDTAGTEISCTGTGQDGEIQAGMAWPEPRFTDNGDGTITDNLTGLIWTKNANLPNGSKTWYEALDYCNNLTLGSYDDWRLPNVNELESLVSCEIGNFVHFNLWLTSQGFPNVQPAHYWSSTSYAGNPDNAWVVHMQDGYVYSYGKSYKNDIYGFVWPVRAGEGGMVDLPQTGQKVSYAPGDDGDLEMGVAWPNPRFTDFGNTVTDNLTGLMWTKNANLPGTRTWQSALDYVKGMNIGTYPNFGFTDWRLPNRKEMYSLTDFSSYEPALPAEAPFLDVQMPLPYWSSTTISIRKNLAWFINPSDGGFYFTNFNKANGYWWSWPVRGGSFGPTVINLSSFTVTPKAGKVIISWTTASEIDNAGFNLYRSESENGEYVKVNDSLVPAEGSATQGATYEFIDDGVKNRATYYYKLEDIDLSGTSTMHGPVIAEPRRLGKD